MLKVKERAKRCDLVVEVRDARVPFSSVNPAFNALVQNKRRLVIYNKVDLADPSANDKLKEQCQIDGVDAMFISATGRGRKAGVTKLVNWLQEESRGRFQTTGTLAMIYGMPNVGKSTLINALASSAAVRARELGRSSNAFKFANHVQGGNAKHLAQVGDRPGVTRAVSSILVSASPLVRLLDTPGIMVPRVGDAEIGLRLALTGAVKDSVAGEELLVEYLLDLLHRRSVAPARVASGLVGARGDATRLLGLGPTPWPMENVLQAVEVASGAAGKRDDQRTLIACRYVLATFRTGSFGPLTLDELLPAPRTVLSSAHGAAPVKERSGSGGCPVKEIAPLLYPPSDIFR